MLNKAVQIFLFGMCVLFIVALFMSGCTQNPGTQFENAEPIDRVITEEAPGTWDLKLLDVFGTETKILDQPPRELKERCEVDYKAFRFFKDSKDRWACKLPDGRVLREGEYKPKL
ncbi:MAG: hypothetical protein ACR2PH_02570 [Desulfobulbia bacterium]